MSAFKAYDIRGIWGKDIDKDLCYRVGLNLPRLLSASAVTVGRDVRLSSDDAYKALTRGITDAGADVWDLGLATTPMVYYATATLSADASVQITASHNSKEYNGLKISRKGALPCGEDSGLRELEAMCKEDAPIAERKGKIIDYSYIAGKYRDFLKAFADIDGLKITVDCSSGMANLIIKDVLGPCCHYINDSFDGSFPAHEPNPLNPDNCRQLGDAVRKDGSDVGVIYDGDADRVVFTDENGTFIQPDYIIALLGIYYKNHGKTGSCVQDIRTSKSTSEYLEKLGFKVYTWKVGHAFAKVRIRELDAVFGGELAGHYYFRDFFWCDSGIYASLLILSVIRELKKEGKTLSQMMKEIIRYANSGEINFRIEDKDKAIDALYRKYSAQKPLRIMDFDGYRIEFSTWWFNVRKSNTEPYLRIVAEADTEEILRQHLDEIRAILENFC